MSQLVPTHRPLHRWLDVRVRRQLLRDGNWRLQVQQSGLPQQVQQLILSLVANTKLMRFEKAEVAAELVAHFEDGHQRGASFEQLVTEFGDPQVAAQLIKTSKQRNRPMFVKIMKASALLIGGAIIAYGVMLFIFHSASPNPKTDYLAVFNETAREGDPELQAWPMYYRDAFREYGLSEGGGNHFEELYVNNADSSFARLVRPEDPEWADAAARLSGHQALLDMFREGSKLPSFGVQLQVKRSAYDREDFEALFPHLDFDRRSDEGFGGEYGIAGISAEANELLDDSIISILLPHIQSFRGVARIFRVDTRLAATETDTERVVENSRAMLGMSRQVAEVPCLVCALVGYAMANLGFENIEEVLTQHPELLGEDELKRLQDHVEALDLASFVNFKGEQAMVEDFIQRIYSDDGNGDGRMTAVGLEVMEAFNRMNAQGGYNGDEDASFLSSARAIRLGRTIVGPITLLTADSRAEVQRQADEFFEQVNANYDLPFWMEGNLGKVDQPKAQVLNLLTPAYEAVKKATERTITNRNATALALAIHRYHRVNDRWPESMEDLLDGWISEPPIDRFTGEPLRFKIDDLGQLTVYGLGPDGDDDGGDRADAGQRPFVDLKQPSDGDWIYWPTIDE